VLLYVVVTEILSQDRPYQFQMVLALLFVKMVLFSPMLMLLATTQQFVSS